MTRDSNFVQISVGKNGRFVAQGSCKTAEEKNQIEKTVSEMSDRLQMELLKIVAELLDYQVSISCTAQSIILEGEKETGSGVNRYLKITKDKNGDGVLVFEHFESKKALVSEQQKFLALGQKMGIKLSVKKFEQSGQPISAGAEHKDFLKGGGGK